MWASSEPGQGSSGAIPSPFLFHFMDDRSGIDVEEFGTRSDLREFIARELGIPPPLGESQTLGPKILIFTSAIDPEADLVGAELLKRGVDYVRVNSEDFPSKVCITWTRDSRISKATLLVGHEEVVPAHISAAWTRRLRPESFGLHFDDPIAAAFALREWQSAIGDFTRSLDCFWVNHPDTVLAASDKLLQLRLASEVGLEIPRTIMTNDPSRVRAFYHECGGYIIAKAVSHHFLEIRGRLFNFCGRRLVARDLNLLDDVRYVPSMFQEYIPKQIELRVTVVGDKIFTVAIHSQISEASRDDYHRGSLKHIPKTVYHLPQGMERKCRSLVRHMGLLFGAVDLILTPDGRYMFLEVNAGGDWRWVEVETGLPITEAVADLLIQGLSACRR